MRKIGILCVVALFGLVSIAAADDIKYQKSVKLNVGQSAILKGARNDDCGPNPPSWSRVVQELPTTDLGTFSDGGVGTIKSKSCGGRVGARAILFTATNPGKAKLKVAGDPVRVVVK